MSVNASAKPVAHQQGEGDARWFLGGLSIIKASGETTEGRVAVTENWAPRGYGSPLHVHHHEVPRGARDLRDGRIREHDHSADDHRSRRDHFDEVEGFSAHGLVQ